MGKVIEAGTLIEACEHAFGSRVEYLTGAILKGDALDDGGTDYVRALLCDDCVQAGIEGERVFTESRPTPHDILQEGDVD